MSLEDLVNIAELISATAVIITLLYLAIQIRQNSKTIRDSTVQTLMISSADAATENFGRGGPLMQKLSTGGELTAEEERLAGSILFSIASYHDNAHYQYHVGNLDERGWSAFEKRIEGFAMIPYFKVWWPHSKRLFSIYFQEYIQGKYFNDT